MGALVRDDLLDAQTIRTLGYAPFGGADLGECLSTVRRVSGVDLDQWHEQWSQTAAHALAAAERSLTSGDAEGARGAFFRAANYFRTAGVMAMGTPLDPRLVSAHQQEVDAFRRGAALLASPPQQLDIPYEGRTLPGYLFRPPHHPGSPPGPQPTLVLTNGYDGTAEELYFCSGAAALARGYNVVTFDGPGQGAMVIDHGVVFRPDWENVISPVIDAVVELPSVDPDRIVLMGLSFGGYLAPRAATRERRLAACVSDCGPYDLFRATASRLPRPLAAQLPDGNPVLLRVLDTLARAVMKKPTAGWALRRSLLVHGVCSPLDYFRLAPQYSLVGLEDQITCPTLVCGTDADDLSSSARTLYDALTCPKRFVEFHAADGAGGHCEAGARTAFHQELFGWLDGVLPQPTGTR